MIRFPSNPIKHYFPYWLSHFVVGWRSQVNTDYSVRPGQNPFWVDISSLKHACCGSLNWKYSFIHLITQIWHTMMSITLQTKVIQLFKSSQIDFVHFQNLWTPLIWTLPGYPCWLTSDPGELPDAFFEPLLLCAWVWFASDFSGKTGFCSVDYFEQMDFVAQLWES